MACLASVARHRSTPSASSKMIQLCNPKMKVGAPYRMQIKIAERGSGHFAAKAHDTVFEPSGPGDTTTALQKGTVCRQPLSLATPSLTYNTNPKRAVSGKLSTTKANGCVHVGEIPLQIFSPDLGVARSRDFGTWHFHPVMYLKVYLSTGVTIGKVQILCALSKALHRMTWLYVSRSESDHRIMAYICIESKCNIVPGLSWMAGTGAQFLASYYILPYILP